MNFTIQQANNKLNNNLLCLKLDDINIVPIDTKNILYKAHYAKPFTHIMFIESLMDNEIKQFVAEFFQNIKISIYHDRKPNLDFINDYRSAAKHIVNKNEIISNTIRLPRLINDQMFLNKDLTKNDDIVCFLEYKEEIPSSLSNLLYPKTKHQIKLFNSPYIKHVQNLGLISESEKADILQLSKYYLPVDDNDEYIAEAVACGCSIVDNLNLQTKDMNIDLSSYQTYASFVKELING
jgi:hypothetical protein